MSTLTDAELDAMEARCDAATKGPWEATTGDPVTDDPNRHSVVRKQPPQYFIAVVENGAPGDTLETEACTAAFIAHSRTDLPRLIAAYRELRKELTDLKARVANGAV